MVHGHLEGVFGVGDGELEPATDPACAGPQLLLLPRTLELRYVDIRLLLVGAFVTAAVLVVAVLVVAGDGDVGDIIDCGVRVNFPQ